MVADVVDLLDRLEVADVHWVGESLGTVLGAAVAVAYPERVRSLTLIHAPTGIGTDAQERQTIGYPTWEQAIAEVGMEEWWYRARAASDDLTGDEAIDGFYARQAARIPLHSAVGLKNVARQFDSRRLLAKVRKPTEFLISSRYSYTTSAEQQQSLVALVPGATLRVYDSRHRSFFGYHDVDIVAPDALSFIKSVIPEPPAGGR
jgi:pimeloyl-ACP methyl ester carboxylesterase